MGTPHRILISDGMTSTCRVCLCFMTAGSHERRWQPYNSSPQTLQSPSRSSWEEVNSVIVSFCKNMKTTDVPARSAHRPLNSVMESSRFIIYLSVAVLDSGQGCISTTSTGRHSPLGRPAAVDCSPGRRPPSRPGLSLSGRRSGWWRDAPSLVWGG